MDNNQTTNGTEGEEFENPHHQHLLIVFIFGCCGLGAVLRILTHKWAEFVDKWKWGKIAKIPYTVFLLIAGLVVAGIGRSYPSVDAYLITNVDPSLFFHVFLPVVLFESAYVIDIHVFRRSVGNVSILAVPGLLMATTLTALLSFILPEIANIPDFKVRMFIALLFGSLISATDPVAVIVMLKELAASATLLLLQKLMLGPVIGYVGAILEGLILQQIYNDALAEITVTLSFTYLIFYIGEATKASGVLAVVTLGLALDRSSITPQVDHFLHRFWEMLAYLANTLIFFLVGVIVSQYIQLFTVADFGYLMILYVGILAIRAISVFTFYPIMNRYGVEMTWKHMVVMTWGGLRGAVGLILALYLNSLAPMLTEAQVWINKTASDNGIDVASSRGFEALPFEQIFLKILVHTGGIVLLTLFINASTTEFVLTKLGMLEVTTAERLTMFHAVNMLENSVKRNITFLKCDRFLADSKWKMVEEYTIIESPYKINAEDEMALQETYNPTLHIANSDDLNFKDLFEEARMRMIKALKMSYMKQYSQGLIQDQGARILISAADKTADKVGEFIDVEHVKKSWEITGFLPYAKRKIEYWMYGRKIKQLVAPRNKYRRKVFRLVTSDTFDYFMQFIIFMNIIPLSFDFALQSSWKNVTTWYESLQVINYIFLGIYTVEVILRYIGLGWQQFRKNRWIQFDLVILFIAFGELIADLIVTTDELGGKSNIANTVKTTRLVKIGRVLRGLRATRLLRLTKTFLPKAVAFINRLINKRAPGIRGWFEKKTKWPERRAWPSLQEGYAVGKGFVTAEEEVNKLIGSICHDRNIQARLLNSSETNRLKVIKEMGLLQRNHPGIATSVKTRNAVRILLNHSKEAIQQLFAGGVLDETELQLLERSIEIKQKRLANFPSFMLPAEQNNIIKNVVWIKDDRILFRYFLDHAVDMYYDYEDVIIEEEEELDGVHIIIEGLVKVSESYYQLLEAFDSGSILRWVKPLASMELKGSFDGHVVNVGDLKNSGVSRPGFDEVDFDLIADEDYLGPGSSFGVLALLTNGFKRCTVTCETAVQTSFMSVEKMEEAFLYFPNLKKTLWKVAAVRIATPLYQEHFEYQAIELVKIHLHLSQGYIVELTRDKPRFSFTSTLVEAVLIFGTVIDSATDEIIESPFLLLRDYEEVLLHWCTMAILLVIPKTDSDVNEVMNPPSQGIRNSSRGISRSSGNTSEFPATIFTPSSNTSRLSGAPDLSVNPSTLSPGHPPVVPTFEVTVPNEEKKNQLQL